MAIKPLDTTLKEMVEEAKGEPITFRKLVTTLRGRGIPVLLIILSLPFCLPIQIPGFSTPFGIAIALMGFRLFLNRYMWWPNWILNKKIPYSTLVRLSDIASRWFKRAKTFVRPRLTWLSQTPLLHRLHGLFILVMALLLAIPFPIPLTNLLSAFPLFFMGLGLLEDDGIMIILSYLIGLVCLVFWGALFFFGQRLFA